MTGYVMVLYFGVLICLLALTAADRNYQINFERVVVLREDPTAKNHIQVRNIKLSKLDKNLRGLSGEVTLMHDLTKDMECHIKVFQKIGAKYMKAPVDFPKKSCCQFTEDNKSMWECIKQNTNLPEKCPVLAGNYTFADKHPNTCELPKVLPPHTPEEFMAEMAIHIDKLEIICVRFNVKINKEPMKMFG